jgi:radical SAM protein with 4Fe4S-binding SPASM domain
MRIRITLVTTGLLIESHAADIAGVADTVVISLDGDRGVHDGIRRIKGGFDKIARGVMALRGQYPPPRLIARSVVQRENFASIDRTINAAQTMGFDEISFLGADVSSTAFNREQPWSADRASEVAIGPESLDAFSAAIDRCSAGNLFDDGFVSGGRASLDRIHQYYSALAGRGEFPPVHCNAPWVSSVVESDGTVRPCFFQPPLGNVRSSGSVNAVLNSAEAIAWREGLDVRRNEICRKCVCTLSLRSSAQCRTFCSRAASSSTRSESSGNRSPSVDGASRTTCRRMPFAWMCAIT